VLRKTRFRLLASFAGRDWVPAGFHAGFPSFYISSPLPRLYLAHRNASLAAGRYHGSDAVFATTSIGTEVYDVTISTPPTLMAELSLPGVNGLVGWQDRLLAWGERGLELVSTGQLRGSGPRSNDNRQRVLAFASAHGLGARRVSRPPRPVALRADARARPRRRPRPPRRGRASRISGLSSRPGKRPFDARAEGGKRHASQE
jgi:hypothetical protein